MDYTLEEQAAYLIVHMANGRVQIRKSKRIYIFGYYYCGKKKGLPRNTGKYSEKE